MSLTFTDRQLSLLKRFKTFESHRTSPPTAILNQTENFNSEAPLPLSEKLKTIAIKCSSLLEKGAISKINPADLRAVLSSRKRAP
jgi:hypothetical protein